MRLFKLSKRQTFRFLLLICATFGVIFWVAKLWFDPSVYHLPEVNEPVPSAVYPSFTTTANLKTRKNILALTPTEKTKFLKALKTLKQTVPEKQTLSIYDQFVLRHVLTMGFRRSLGATGAAQGNPAHSYPAFLPWHRQFLREFEAELQKVDPTVTLPYWDWTDPKALDVILQDDFLGPRGTGETIEIWGKQYTGGKVDSGFFTDWELNETIHFDPITLTSLGTKLRRFVALPPCPYPIPAADVDQLMQFDHYEIFNALIEGAITLNSENKFVPGWALHACAHSVIGGSLVDPDNPLHQTRTLGTMDSIPSSPYDPIFWLNHANVDRLWAAWQDQGHTGTSFYPSQGMPFGHNLHDPMWPWDGGQSQPGKYGLGKLAELLTPATSVVTAADVLDFRALGYTYDER